MFSVKHIYKKTTNKKWMLYIKKSYYPLRMWNEWNGATNMRDNRTMNTPVPVIHDGLWPSSETREHHVLNLFHPYSLWDIQRSEILPNRHIIPTWKLSFFCIFFWISFAPRTKNHATYMVQITYLLVNEK
jgi:hypothetical protein